MDIPRDMEAHGPFDARYLAFLETISQLRPRLHRYCSRMTGSVLDGEDVVQERLVLTLPPKERACVLLKEVFEYSLEEIAELIGSSVGAVKSALNRGRSKLN